MKSLVDSELLGTCGYVSYMTTIFLTPFHLASDGQYSKISTDYNTDYFNRGYQ